MKITRITFDTEDGRTFELAGEEELLISPRTAEELTRMLLGLSFTPNMSGGFRWRRIDNPVPLPFLSPLAALRDIHLTQMEIAYRNLREEVNRVGRQS